MMSISCKGTPDYWNAWSPGTTKIPLGSGCGSVVTAATSNTGGSWFEASHWQILYWTFTVNCNEKKRKKRPRKSHLKNQIAVLQNFAKSVRFISTLVFSFGRYDLANRSTFWQCITLWSRQWPSLSISACLKQKYNSSNNNNNKWRAITIPIRTTTPTLSAPNAVQGTTSYIKNNHNNSIGNINYFNKSI